MGKTGQPLVGSDGHEASGSVVTERHLPLLAWAADQRGETSRRQGVLRLQQLLPDLDERASRLFPQRGDVARPEFWERCGWYPSCLGHGQTLLTHASARGWNVEMCGE